MFCDLLFLFYVRVLTCCVINDDDEKIENKIEGKNLLLERDAYNPLYIIPFYPKVLVTRKLFYLRF